MLMRLAHLFGTAMLCLLFNNVFSQQLKLGKNPYTVQKSAVLELNSDNQGLLLVRISDTTLINSLSPPDGMVIYFTPTSQLYVRSGAAWKAIPFASALNNYWSITGNVTGGVKTIGSTDNFAVSFISNNTERVRIDATGNMGVGTSSPSTILHVKTGVTDNSGLRLENLTSSSATTSGAAVIGVDATGKVVRTKTPVYYTNGIGGSANTEEITKIWIAEVTNTASGTQTINIPANVSFTNIISIQLTTKGGSGTTTAPVAMITSNTTSSITIRVLESKSTTIVLGGTAEGLEAHTDTATKIYIRVEGN